LIKIDRSADLMTKAKLIAQNFADLMSQKKKSLSKLEKSSGFKLTKAKKLNRNGRLPGNLQDPRILKDAFMESSPISHQAKVYDAAGGFLVVKRSRRIKPDAKKIEELSQKGNIDHKTIHERLKGDKFRRVFEQWIQSQKKAAKITQNIGLIRS